MRRAWRWVLAWARLSDAAICEMSRGRDMYSDFHDWRDSTAGAPWHLYRHTCKRCGKKFYI